ncbi:hypothetical protein RAG37_11515 [Klebsiella pneumoniae]
MIACALLGRNLSAGRAAEKPRRCLPQARRDGWLCARHITSPVLH